MDLFDHNTHVQNDVCLNYNRKDGQISIDYEPIHDADWITYRNVHFEHSDTCPSRRNRLVHEKLGQDPKISKDRYMRMAVCCYILDKTGHLLLTRRPSWLTNFP